MGQSVVTGVALSPVVHGLYRDPVPTGQTGDSWDVTTNLAFAEWVTVFAGDEKLTTALLDRLAHHATVLTTKGKSYRMRKRRGREEPS